MQAVGCRCRGPCLFETSKTARPTHPFVDPYEKANVQHPARDLTPQSGNYRTLPPRCSPRLASQARRGKCLGIPLTLHHKRALAWDGACNKKRELVVLPRCRSRSVLWIGVERRQRTIVILFPRQRQSKLAKEKPLSQTDGGLSRKEVYLAPISARSKV